MTVTRETSLFSDGPLVESVEDFTGIKKQNLNYERKHIDI